MHEGRIHAVGIVATSPRFSIVPQIGLGVMPMIRGSGASLCWTLTANRYS